MSYEVFGCLFLGDFVDFGWDFGVVWLSKIGDTFEAAGMVISGKVVFWP